ncbi:protein AF-9 [Plodia interpunctella]|uniref:protein AF-9 n=1 Tax=Plodia interpunctella TaxID=58824 RepID=UPI0023674308|nr:protein AF-9 [Plodia interpunctella]XP_053612106.1 protein AF-9 [Plodia interpunctella]
MTSIKVNFEIGHVASLRSKKTPEGFTHDWEVFVRGQEGADISHFVDKVVFNLHNTFHKPRRVVKEPPFSLKESGYAGFLIPIDIYLKNKDEPKKIPFVYDLNLHNSGLLKDRYVFQNPNDEFKKKLLKGGGITVRNDAYYTNPDQESRSRDSFSDDKPQMTSKPKMSSENVKKHKVKEHKEEVPHKTSSFETLFGPPIQKPPKVSPDPKKIEKNVATVAKPDKKERSSSDKKSKHDHKESKSEKVKAKEEKDKPKQDKVKSHNKEQERTKDKPNKRTSDRPPSPEPAKKRCVSPVRKPPSPPPRSSSASSFKEEYKPPKHDISEQKKQKTEDKAPEIKTDKESKEKKKKEKKSHDRDKERKEKKEHKKDSHKSKESPKEIVKEIAKPREIPKEIVKESPPIKEKLSKPEKNKFSIENLRKTPPPENVERLENHKSKDKGDSEKRHKHKKKDKKRDESREKHKESSKEKKHRHEKNREIVPEPVEIIERRETPVSKERSLPEPASPISIDTASQCSSKSGIAKTSHIGNEDVNSSHSDSESSIIAEEEELKVKVENPSPEPLKHEPSPEIEPEPEPEVEPEPEPVVEPPHKEKSRKHKDKSSKREEKRRKRKAAEEEEETRKLVKTENSAPLNADMEKGESSGSTSVETKVQDNGVSSSLGEDAEPGDLSPEYMGQLRDLQKRIMTINNNEDLERVVNLIAETGRYEVTTQTFDFDLCLLDRSTVQQLIQLVGC